MLFNSYQFLFFFFPLTIAIYFALYRVGRYWQHGLMLAASLVFYGWWDVRFLVLLISSFTINYLAGLIIANRTAVGRQGSATYWLAAAVVLNLGVLAVFKYAYFAVVNVNTVFGTDFVLGSIILPLGISFFTFEQISFLVDVRRGEARPSLFLHYALFVSFFPRLVAGPILRYHEIVPQFAGARPPDQASADLAIGLTMFFLGLVKKSFLADGVAPYATSVFTAAAHGESVDLLLAWGGALAYTCQLYFDFSGYSDMAIGAARCFGVRFPMNFNSPYQATSIIEFWRRWHMTLSRFLRDYLYFGLGGNRRGRARRYANLLITMLLGGLWHGAHWTFIIWGGLHGIFLMINHGWLALAGRSRTLTALRATRVANLFALGLTFVAVVSAWVFFRSPTFAAALNLLRGMSGMNGVRIPLGLEFAVRPIHGLLAAMGIGFAEGSGTAVAKTYLWVIGLLAIAFFLPNTQQLLARYEPVLEMIGRPTSALPNQPLRWHFSRVWAVAIGCIAVLGIISITRVSEFLYWQF